MRVRYVLLVFSLAFALGLSAVAAMAGSALIIGAFAAGLILSGTNQFDTIERDAAGRVGLRPDLLRQRRRVGRSARSSIRDPRCPGDTLDRWRSHRAWHRREGRGRLGRALDADFGASSSVSAWCRAARSASSSPTSAGASGVLSDEVFGAVLLMVMATTFVAPLALKALFGDPAAAEAVEHEHRRQGPDSAEAVALAPRGSRGRSCSPTGSSTCCTPATSSCSRRPRREGDAAGRRRQQRRLACGGSGKGADRPLVPEEAAGPGARRPRGGRLRGALRRGHPAGAHPGARARRAGQGRRLHPRPRSSAPTSSRPVAAGSCACRSCPAFSTPPSWSVCVPRPDGRAERPAPPARPRARRQSLRRRLLPDPDGRHAGALHRQRRSRRARVQEGQRRRLGHRGVRHAAARHPSSAPSRERNGPGGRTQEIQRLIGRSLRAAMKTMAFGEYTIRDRLRRAAGRRRHPHREHHRRLRGAGRRLRLAGASAPGFPSPFGAAGGGGVGRDRRRARRASTSPTSRTATPAWTPTS